ncbi:MAG TPA: hypothetical protein VGM92_10755 [Candidatus Kapabacteria bacterium]
MTRSLEGVSHRITILGDRLSPELQAFFQQFHVSILNEELGNDRSLLRSIRLACESNSDEWVYLCEDDYVHVPHTFHFITDLILHREEYLRMRSPIRFKRGSERFLDIPLVIHPPDYPDRYLRRYRRFSLLFISRFCHWRQISSTTFTFLAETKTFQRFRPLFEKSTTGARDGYLSQELYGSHFFGKKALALSPIPGLATHMHEDVMTPFVDWKDLVQHYLLELNQLSTTPSVPARD